MFTSQLYKYSVHDMTMYILLNKNKYIDCICRFLFTVRGLRRIVVTTNTAIVAISLNLEDRYQDITDAKFHHLTWVQ